MLTENRWQKEQELMSTVFPTFQPFAGDERFGFHGYLKGPRSRRLYGVTLEADRESYPQLPPRVRMTPQLGMHWIGDGERRRLCVERDWRPARSTFANTLLALVRYLDQFDPYAGASRERPGEEERSPGCVINGIGS